MNIVDVKLPSNRKFGLFFALIFLITSIYFYKQNIITLFYLFGVLFIIFLILAIIKPIILIPLNKLWMRIGLILGMIVNPIVIGSIFFVIFTPIAIFMRLLRRDELFLQFKKKKSFWIIRDKENQSVQFRNQF